MTPRPQSADKRMLAALDRLIKRTSKEFAASRCGISSKYIDKFARGEQWVYPSTMRIFEMWYHARRKNDTAAWKIWRKIERDVARAHSIARMVRLAKNLPTCEVDHGDEDLSTDSDELLKTIGKYVEKRRSSFWKANDELDHQSFDR